MPKQVLLTTTGTEASFRVPDLGIGFIHPVTDQDLLAEYRVEAIRDSESLQAAVTNGYCTLKNENGVAITNLVENLTPQFSIEKEQNDGGRTSELEVSPVDAYSTATVNFTALADTARYEIKWYAEISVSKNKKTCECQIIFDGSETIAEFTKTNDKKNKFESISGFIYKDVAVGAHSVSLDINTDENGVSVKIRRITIAVEKK